MPRARNRYERCRQVLRWILAEWPAGRRVQLDFAKKLEDGIAGECYRERRTIVIRLLDQRCCRCLIDTLIHEAAHAILWPVSLAELRVEHHGPEFWALYGQITDRFDHDHGAEQSMDYPTE